MIEQAPAYISIVFLITSFLTFGIFAYAIKRVGFDHLWSKLLLFLVPFWMLFQAVIAMGGFYLHSESFPPRLPVFAVLPAVILIAVCFLTGRDFIERLPLKALTILHFVRIPVELTLAWLYEQGSIPREMTFRGWNFDILSGILAVVVTFVAFRGARVNRSLLIGYNLLGLALLANIVTIAIMSLQSPMQKLAFEMPNRGVLYFPYIWLPAMIVPIVLFCHLASLYKLLQGAPNANEPLTPHRV
jgi:hypothetical protein